MSREGSLKGSYINSKNVSQNNSAEKIKEHETPVKKKNTLYSTNYSVNRDY